MLKTGMYDSGFHRCRFERKKNMDPAQNNRRVCIRQRERLSRCLEIEANLRKMLISCE